MMTTIEYFGAIVNQRNSQETPRFFTFYARTSEVVKWAGVRRTIDHEAGTQRVLMPARRSAVKRYLAANGKNTLPGCIIIGFKSDSVRFEAIDTECDTFDNTNRCENQLAYGKISINYDENIDFENDSHKKPGLIVDGQHRLKGCGDFTQEDLPLLIVALLESTVEEEAFQFIVINQKASKVKTTNIKSIIADLAPIEESLSSRLSDCGIRYGSTTPTLNRLNSDPSSPFYKLLDWEINARDAEAKQVVAVTAIESCIKNFQVAFKGLLEDQDNAEAVFIDIWSTLKLQFPSIWNDDPDNKFLKKVNILAVNEFIISDLVMKWATSVVDPLESSDLKSYVVSLFSNIPEAFWTTQWTVVVQDNSNIRKLIQDDLRTMMINGKIGTPWQTGLKVVQR
jgi:DGQHR domain-containing protein